MRTRDYVIEHDKALDDTGTLIKDIDIIDPVSALYLEFKGTNGGTSNLDNFLSDVITKVEIVDGSEVLYALNLAQLEALHFYKLKRTPVLFPSEWAGGMQRHGCYLLFGRHLWDRDYAMDFTRFRNPQLKITTNIAAIRDASDDTAFVSESLRGSVVAKIMEDVPGPTKYLMAKEVDSFVSVGSGSKRIDLPRDLKYRLLLARFWKQGSDIDEIISEIKLTCDSDKFVLFNRKTQQLDAEAFALFGDMSYKHDALRGGSATIRIIPNKEPHATLFNKTTGIGRMITLIAQWSSGIEIELYSDATTTDPTARQLTSHVTGHAIHASLPVVFGLMDEPDTWFDPTTYGKVEAILDDDVADAVCEVALEQERPLP